MEQENVLVQERQPYTPPNLERHGQYAQVTGWSFNFEDLLDEATEDGAL
ncbi:MAG: hypothetical protein HC933_18575 [Pleurocapsa sp. SU_196_0]|nr:hypothetical protein [Pleurocapsa sp. SU_196_0]